MILTVDPPKITVNLLNLRNPGSDSSLPLLSEDMQHGQLIEKTLKIINPFHKSQ